MLQHIKTYPAGSAFLLALVLVAFIGLGMLALSCYVQIRDHGIMAVVSTFLQAVGALVVLSWVLRYVPALVRWLDGLVR